VGRRGPKPTGKALSNAVRQRLWRQRQRGANSVTLSSEKPASALEFGSVTGKLLQAAESQDWSAVLGAAVLLGFEPPPFDPADVRIAGVGFKNDTKQCTISFWTAAAVPMLAWAAAHPAVLNVTTTATQRGYELTTTDPLAVLDSLLIPRDRMYTETGNKIETKSPYHALLSVILPFRLLVAKDREVKQHLRWVRDHINGRWAREDEIGEGQMFPVAVYYFESQADAALAKMFIG
jgi:hypothetical protein